MIQELEIEPEISRLSGPALVAWLVANTEKLVLVASTLDERAADLSPSIPRGRVIELCQTVRHASLEVTVALLALLSQSEDESASSVLAEAVAHAHVRVQELENTPSSSTFRTTQSGDEKASRIAEIGRR